MSDLPRKIEVHEVTVAEDDSEAGACFEVSCPTCGDRLYLAGSQWWSNICRCGYAWHVTLTATGDMDGRVRG